MADYHLPTLTRDDSRCFRCGTASGSLNIHHRQYRSGGQDDTAPNLITLCGMGNTSGCHGWVHGHKHAAIERGWAISRHSSADPAALPVWHYRRGWVLLTADWRIINDTTSGGDPDGSGEGAEHADG